MCLEIGIKNANIVDQGKKLGGGGGGKYQTLHAARTLQLGRGPYLYENLDDKKVKQELHFVFLFIVGLGGLGNCIMN